MHPPVRVVIEHQRLGSSGIGSLNPGHANGGHSGKEHRKRGRQEENRVAVGIEIKSLGRINEAS